MHLAQFVGLGIQNGHAPKAKATHVQDLGQHTCEREIPECWCTFHLPLFPQQIDTYMST